MLIENDKITCKEILISAKTYASINKAFEYLKDNAYKFGFILRYPEGKEHITGYNYEPWHYRYVGKIAKHIYEYNLTLEEYIYENILIY